MGETVRYFHAPHGMVADSRGDYVAAEDLESLRAEVSELHEQADRLGDLLTRTANALKGPPSPLSLHSWHDLPEVAEKLAELLTAALKTAGRGAAMSGDWDGGCECSSWCRANPQPITDKHHMGCTHYNDTIKVVKISLEGHGSYCDADIAGALQALADGGDYCYQVEIMDMLKRDYDVLPEFEGF